METAIELNESYSNLLYFMALVLYCLGRLNDSLKTIEKAMEKAEKNYAKYLKIIKMLFQTLLSLLT